MHAIVPSLQCFSQTAVMAASLPIPVASQELSAIAEPAQDADETQALQHPLLTRTYSFVPLAPAVGMEQAGLGEVGLLAVGAFVLFRFGRRIHHEWMDRFNPFRSLTEFDAFVERETLSLSGAWEVFCRAFGPQKRPPTVHSVASGDITPEEQAAAFEGVVIGRAFVKLLRGKLAELDEQAQAQPEQSTWLLIDPAWELTEKFLKGFAALTDRHPRFVYYWTLFGPDFQKIFSMMDPRIDVVPCLYMGESGAWQAEPPWNRLLTELRARLDAIETRLHDIERGEFTARLEQARL